ncbi:MAG TPA: hypothetical protein VGI26_06645 [Solirubrobacteraceae bacterium]
MGILLIAGLCLASLASEAQASPSRPIARATRRVYLVEAARLKPPSREEGSAITEHGEAKGTYNAPVTVAFTIHPKIVDAKVAFYLSGGSIRGSAHANFKIVGKLAYFGGEFTVSKGTGKYSHASEVNHKPLGFSGIINRETYEAEVKAKGELNL